MSDPADTRQAVVDAAQQMAAEHLVVGTAGNVSGRLPEIGPAVLTATLASTVFFELVGPVFTRRVLEAVGEAGPREGASA